MRQQWYFIICMLTGLGLSACGSYGDAGDSEPVETSDLNLSVEAEGDNDVAGFKFVAKQVYCDTGDPVVPGNKYWAKESLEEMYLPGENDTFVEEPYDEDSQHRFADHLFVVEPGCYDLYAKPITEDKQSSQDCAVSVRRNVDVTAADAIHEHHLISQCRGEARTTLDIIGSLNNPPRIEGDLEIQKFVCTGGGVRACVTASDPDGDPLRIGFYEADEDDLSTANKVGTDRTWTSEDGQRTHCATLPATETGSLEYKAVVQDLGWDGSSKVPIEELLTDELYGEQQPDSLDFDPTESRAVVKFPIHAIEDCIAGAMAFIGTTFGAKIDETATPLSSDPNWGMSDSQSKLLAENAINHVNPNPLGDPDPRILLVLDDADTEDQIDADYIKQQLELYFSDVTLIDEPTGGIDADDVVGYKIVWLINPGYPIDDPLTYDTMKAFRENGGGVIVSGDDATQAVDMSGTRDMDYFSFLDYLGDYDADNDGNGTIACGEPTDNNNGERYLVEFEPDSPLTENGLEGETFPYGNDIDRATLADLHATVGAITRGLTMSGVQDEATCLDLVRDVMTTVPSDELFDGTPSP